MEELLKDVGFKKKVKSLSPIVRKALIESLLDLYEQETEDMIDVIEESRIEIRNSVLAFKNETEHLRSQSHLLQERRRSQGLIGDDHVRDKKGTGRVSKVSYVNECTEKDDKAVREYIRKRDRHRLKGPVDNLRSSTSLSEPASASLRPTSVHSTRSLPTPVITKTLEEQTDDIMKDLTHADRKAQRERQRQTDMIEKRKEKKRMQRSREEKAMELLEKALLMDKQLAMNKERQERKVQERITEIKQRKEKERETPAFGSDVKIDPLIELEKF